MFQAPIFNQDISFGDPDKYDYRWTIREDFSYNDDNQMTLIGGALRNDMQKGFHTLYFKFDEFLDDEHDHCYAAILNFVNFTPTYGYSTLCFDGLLISGQWYTKPVTDLESLVSQSDSKGRRDAELCSDKNGECYYNRADLGVHYMNAPYQPPHVDVRPTRMRIEFIHAEETE